MAETQLANSDSARDASGTIVDQAGSGLGDQTTQTSESTATGTDTKSADQTTQATTTTDSTPKEGETLLTEGDPKPEEKTEAKGPPEKYADYKLPEGVALQPEVVEKANTLFRELGLTQDQAQKLIDLDVERAKAIEAAPIKAYETMRADWQTKAKSDPDIAKVAVDGKVGLDAVKINVAKVYNAIGDAKLVGEFKQVMDLTGVGDNPAFIKFVNKLSEFVVEGKHVSGGGPSPHGQNQGGTQTKPSAAQAMYPSLPSANTR